MALSVSINAFSPAPARRDQEAAILVEALKNLEQTLRAGGGTVTSGNIFIAGASGSVNVGTFTWTPQGS